MSLGKTWYDLVDAEEKFGIAHDTMLEWVEEGLIRFEKEGGLVVRVNGDDIELQIAHLGEE